MIHSPTTTNCLFLLLSLHSLLFSFPYGDGFPAGKGRNVDAIRRKNEDLDAERALNRTMTKLRSEHGRFIMLACKTKCLKERAEIPNWIRDFNSLQNRSNNRLMINKSSGNQTPASQNDDPPLGFHFHFYRRPFPDTEMEKAMKSPKAAIFYVVGGKAFPAGAGILGKKEKFMKWLEKFEQAKIARMPEEEMDGWLNSECHGDWLPRKRAENQLTLLVIHDHEYCPETLLNNFARSFADNQNFLALDLQRPLADEAEFILHWRLPGLSNNCRMGILLLGNQYLELPAGILGSELHNIGQNLTAQGNANRNCSTVNIGIGADELQMQDILPPLNSIELEFLREEKHLKAIEQNRQYLTVGAIGGVSILALAMSIFWGLNGNDFVPKQ